MITVNGKPLEWTDGMTVRDVLEAKKYSFNLITVWLNGIPYSNIENFSIIEVPDQSEVHVLHIFAGG